MNASGNRVVTDRTKSCFPGVLLTGGPRETDVSTYVFYIYPKSVEQYEEIFKQLNSNKHGQECGYQFVMCRVVIEESGQVKVLGMVQFKKEPGLIEQVGCDAVIEQDKYTLKRLLDASSGIPFFHEIEDCNVNNVYEWLEWRGTGRIFKHGVFVGVWHINDVCEQDADSSSEQDADSSSEQEVTTGCAGCSNCSTLGCSGNSLDVIFCI